MATSEQIRALDQAGRALMGCGCLIVGLVLAAVVVVVIAAVI